MPLTHYTHRLPADYDLPKHWNRAKVRGPHWDHAPAQHFEAFVLRERGVPGSAESGYGSIDPWRDADGLRDLRTTPRFDAVAAAFDGPAVDERIVVEAGRGRAADATLARIADRDIPVDSDLAQVVRAEAGASPGSAYQDGTRVSVVGPDTARWRIKRVALFAEQPEIAPGATLHPIVHLSHPCLDTLPRAQTGESAR